MLLPNIRFQLNSRLKPNSEGKFPLYMQISKNSQKTVIPASKILFKDDFNIFLNEEELALFDKTELARTLKVRIYEIEAKLVVFHKKDGIKYLKEAIDFYGTEIRFVVNNSIKSFRNGSRKVESEEDKELLQSLNICLLACYNIDFCLWEVMEGEPSVGMFFECIEKTTSYLRLDRGVFGIYVDLRKEFEHILKSKYLK